MIAFVIALLAFFDDSGFVLRDSDRARSPAATRQEAASAEGSRRTCEARLAVTARRFEALLPPGAHGEVTETHLATGVIFAEYNVHAGTGVDYQVAVTMEPDNDGEATGWRRAPGCNAGEQRCNMVRHEHGRLAGIFASGEQAITFAQMFESAADDCVAGVQ